MERFKIFLTKEEISDWVKLHYSPDYIKYIQQLYYEDYFPLGNYKGEKFYAYNQVARENKIQWKEVDEFQTFLQSYTIQDNIRTYRFVNLSVIDGPLTDL